MGSSSRLFLRPAYQPIIPSSQWLAWRDTSRARLQMRGPVQLEIDSQNMTSKLVTPQKREITSACKPKLASLQSLDRKTPPQGTTGAPRRGRQRLTATGGEANGPKRSRDHARKRSNSTPRWGWFSTTQHGSKDWTRGDG